MSLLPRADTIPTRSWILGYLPIVPLVAAGIMVWFVGPVTMAFITAGAIYWSAILFFFLAGVRRGLSFFTEGGPQPAQLITMGLLFALGLVIFLMPYAGIAVALAALGFLGVAVIDPHAARRGEVPAFFRILRPPQMGLAALSMTSILLALLF
ncbi:DUF3429 domain-containing protein [Salinisphaera sp. Q1T1-3]|uniref:DUF3429 domain-containing protein n=1 Tax=Salinisphaera sp. Q1T1-3 TaxID=2321229 RepID=UPI000E72122F|nr:DUF3429 domain-containing protein [Salinisphaera sp. Q1T1-3]RJS91347.1 DUF3429 family protein [Salinisphaera sp. Q1T1-3]